MSWFKKEQIDPNSFEKIYPKCLDDKCLHFVGGDSIYYPCCFTRVGEGREQFLNLINNKTNSLDIRLKTRRQILNSKPWKKLIASFSKKPMSTCLVMCGKESKPTENFDGRNGFKNY